MKVISNLLRIEQLQRILETIAEAINSFEQMEGNEDRVILLVDIDHFELQVFEVAEQVGNPRVLVNQQRKIFSVSPEARQLGINKKIGYLENAQEIYSSVIPIVKPSWPSGRARMTKVFESAFLIVQTINDFLHKNFGSNAVFQFDGNDEYYIDLTEAVRKIEEDDCAKWLDSHGPIAPFAYVYFDNELSYASMIECSSTEENGQQASRLWIGAIIAYELSDSIKNATGFSCSVGVATNKLIAKIASSDRKPIPSSITVATPSGFKRFSQQVNISRLPKLGSGFGTDVKEVLNIETMDQLSKIDQEVLLRFKSSHSEYKGISVTEILRIANGIDTRPVSPKMWHGLDFVIDRRIKPYEQEFYSLEDTLKILDEQMEEVGDRLDFEKKHLNRYPCRIILSLNIQDLANAFTFQWDDQSNEKLQFQANMVDTLKVFFGNKLKASWESTLNQYKLKSVKFNTKLKAI